MRSFAAALAGLVIFTACDTSGPDAPPPAQLVRGNHTSSPVVGEDVEISVTARDADSKVVPGEQVTWTASGGGSAAPGTSTTDENGVARTTWTIGSTAGEQTLLARARDVETSFTVTAVAGPAAELTITPDGGTLTSLGDSLELDLDARDEYGNAARRTGLKWSSSDPSVAEVTGAGVVIARKEGTARIEASLDDATGEVTVVVDQEIADIAVELWTTVLATGEAYDLEARAVDARGSAVDTTLSVAWTSSDPEVASVSASGRVEARSAGDVVITAEAGPWSGTLEVTVKDGPRPEITAISPAVLTAGGAATITGVGFSATPSANEVTVAGIEATVTSASATELTITVPPFGSLPCGPTSAREVRVTVNELTARSDHPIAGAPQHALDVGGAAVLGPDELGCTELPNAGSYVVTVFNATPSPTSTTAFRVRGSGGGTADALLATAGLAPAVPHRTRASRGRTPEPEVVGHLRMLEKNRSLLAALGAPRPRTGLLPQSARVSAEPAGVGDLRTFRITDIDENDLCREYVEVTARAVYAGAKGIVWEDTAAPLAGTMDDRWRAIGEEFDQVMYPVLLEYFGDPLVYDDQLDGDGRFNMLFSRTVNNFDAGVAGFVFSGDFFPPTQCPASNAGEIFYGRVPTQTGTGYDGFTAERWAWEMRSTVIHEVKHIVSYAYRIRDRGTGAPNYEDQWLEESTARLAEEFYARALFGYGQGDNTTYDESIFCEVRVGANWPQCDPFPYTMAKHFGAIHDYYEAIESLSPIGKAVDSDWTFYGSGWLFVRWAIDQSGVPEADFVRALVDDDLVRGIANIEARTGRSFRDLLADFSLAIAADDHPAGFAPADPAHAHPSWNTRDIFRGFNEDFPESSPPWRPWPLQPTRLSGGDFDVGVPSLQGGSTTVFEVDLGPGQTQLLQVLGESGGVAPQSLGAAILRVQ